MISTQRWALLCPQQQKNATHLLESALKGDCFPSRSVIISLDEPGDWKKGNREQSKKFKSTSLGDRSPQKRNDSQRVKNLTLTLATRELLLGTVRSRLGRSKLNMCSSSAILSYVPHYIDMRALNPPSTFHLRTADARYRSLVRKWTVI